MICGEVANSPRGLEHIRFHLEDSAFVADERDVGGGIDIGKRSRVRTLGISRPAGPVRLVSTVGIASLVGAVGGDNRRVGNRWRSECNDRHVVESCCLCRFGKIKQSRNSNE